MLQSPKVGIQSEKTHGKARLAKWSGRSANLSRCSNRKPARNAVESVIGGPTKGDSNSFDGGETVSAREERRIDGALFSDAPTETRTPVSSLKGWRPSPLDDGGN